MLTAPLLRVRSLHTIRHWMPAVGLLLLCAAMLPGATVISQFGITWTFDKDYPTGQFANGDWWVVGPVKIVAINPKSTTTSGRTINGSMVNPTVGKAQGYDSATYANYGTSYSGNVAAGVSAASPLILSAGSSLVSAISHATAGQRPQLTSAAILTVLSGAAPAGSFRPPYTGTDKTLRWNTSQLQRARLRSLPKVTNTPLLSTVEAMFERPWLEHNPDWTGRYIHPSGNMPDYGRDIANNLAEGLLSLQLDYTQAQKEKLLIRLVQYGIDVYGVAKAGGVWFDNGGHGQGRKMPLILAGLMLGDANFITLADGSRKLFQEDRQTWYVTQSDVGRDLYTADDRPRVEYIQSDVGIAEWGEQHTRNPTRDGRNWDTYYRDVCGHSYLGHALTAHLMQAQTSWKWAPFLDYSDRYWAHEKTSATGGGNAIRPFVHAMWTAYRSAQPGNTAPTIAAIADQTTATGVAKAVTVTVTVGDGQTAAGSLVVAASSSNIALVPNGNLVVTGSTASRTLTVTPAAGQSGSATITVVVTDGGGLSASDSFVLTVTATATSGSDTTANGVDGGGGGKCGAGIGVVALLLAALFAAFRPVAAVGPPEHGRARR